MQTHRVLWLAALAVLALAIGRANAARLPGAYMNEFHTGHITPHVPWARPFVGGRTRAFFIAPWTAGREVAELAQRLDLEVCGETTFNDRQLGGTDRYTAMIDGTSPEEKLRSLRRKLAGRYDVFVIANFAFNALPTEIQYRIAKQVTEGAGLVLVSKRPAREEFFKHPDPKAAKRITAGVPFAGLDFYRDTFLDRTGVKTLDAVPDRLVRAARARRGRVVQLDFGRLTGAKYGGHCLTPQEPFTFRSAAQYEYHQMLVANAVLWATGNEPPVRVGALSVAKTAVGTLPCEAELTLDAVRAVGRAMATITIRNAWGDLEHTSAHALRLDAGAHRVALALPALCGGAHYVDVQVRAGGKAVGWGSAWLKIESPTRIAEVTLDKLSFERTEPLMGTVRLAAPAPDGLTLEVRLLDNYQRVFATSRVGATPGGTEVRFAVALDAALSLAGRCRVRLVRGGKALDEAEAEFVVPRRRLDVFPTLLWGTFPGLMGHFVNEQLRSAGFNMILAPHYRADVPEHGENRQIGALARDDMLCMPYAAHITRWRNDALGSDAAYAKHRDDALAMVRHLKPFGPFVYSLGDENSLIPTLGFQPDDKPAFVAHLKTTYRSLAALNAAWGAKLARWDDAEPVGRGKAGANLAAYHDTECYREALYARWHRWYHDLFQAEDAHARVGSEGSQPGNLEQSIAGLEFWGPYRRTVDNTLLRSLAPRSLVRGNWFGGYNSRRVDVPGLRRFLWDTFLDGNNLFEIYCCYTSETIFRTDLSFGYWTQAFLPDLRQVVDGIGQLAAASDHETDPVAVYHSQASVHAARVGPPFGQRRAIHEGLLALIEDAGYQPYYTTSTRVLGGALRGRDAPKALFLGCAQALGDAEARQLVAFVEAGGVLIADVCPGIHDHHCSPRAAGVLDTLFGVRRTDDRVKPARGHLTMPATGLSFGDQRVAVPALDIEAAPVDTAVWLAGGRALAIADGTPAIVVHGVGKGLAVLLNVPFSACKTDDDARRGLRDLVAGLVGFAGLSPACRVLGDDGEPLLGCRAPRFRRGSVRTLMLLPRRHRREDTPVRARLELADAAHIYDQRTGRYLGHRASVRLTLHPASATVLSLLPYRVRGLRVTGDRTVETGDWAKLDLALRADGNAAGHVFRVKLVRPDGKELWLGARTLKPEGATATVRLPFAHNAMPGAWTARVRDVATREEARFRVQIADTK